MAVKGKVDRGTLGLARTVLGPSGGELRGVLLEQARHAHVGFKELLRDTVPELILKKAARDQLGAATDGARLFALLEKILATCTKKSDDGADVDAATDEAASPGRVALTASERQLLDLVERHAGEAKAGGAGSGDDETAEVASSVALRKFLQVYVRRQFCLGWCVPWSCAAKPSRNTKDQWAKRANNLHQNFNRRWKKLANKLNSTAVPHQSDGTRLPWLAVTLRMVGCKGEHIPRVIDAVATCVDGIREIFEALVKVDDNARRTLQCTKTDDARVLKLLTNCRTALRKLQSGGKAEQKTKRASAVAFTVHVKGVQAAPPSMDWQTESRRVSLRVRLTRDGGTLHKFFETTFRAPAVVAACLRDGQAGRKNDPVITGQVQQPLPDKADAVALAYHLAELLGRLRKDSRDSNGPGPHLERARKALLHSTASLHLREVERRSSLGMHQPHSINTLALWREQVFPFFFYSQNRAVAMGRLRGSSVQVEKKLQWPQVDGANTSKPARRHDVRRPQLVVEGGIHLFADCGGQHDTDGGDCKQCIELPHELHNASDEEAVVMVRSVEHPWLQGSPRRRIAVAGKGGIRVVLRPGETAWVNMARLIEDGAERRRERGASALATSRSPLDPNRPPPLAPRFNGESDEAFAMRKANHKAAKSAYQKLARGRKQRMAELDTQARTEGITAEALLKRLEAGSDEQRAKAQLLRWDQWLQNTDATDVGTRASPAPIQHGEKDHRPVQLQLALKSTNKSKLSAAKRKKSWEAVREAIDKRAKHRSRPPNAVAMDTSAAHGQSARTLQNVLDELLDLARGDSGAATSAKERRRRARKLYDLTMEAEAARGEDSSWRFARPDERLGKKGRTLKELGLDQTRLFQYRELLSPGDLDKWRRVWSFIMPSGRPPGEAGHEQGMWVASIDPGVRTFLTIYDPCAARLYRIGHGTAQRVDRRWQGRRRKLDQELSRIQRRVSGIPGQDTNLWRAHTCYANRKHRAQKRADREIRALHQAAVAFLVGVFDVVILPEFDVSRMTKKKRRISGPVSRTMRSLHFGEFRDRLLAACTGHRAKAELFDAVDESYTSKCCGSCGSVNRALGASKVFRCGTCRGVECRDGGAARKIFIKFLLWFAAADAAEELQVCGAVACSPRPPPRSDGVLHAVVDAKQVQRKHQRGAHNQASRKPTSPGTPACGLSVRIPARVVSVRLYGGYCLCLSAVKLCRSVASVSRHHY